MSESQDRRSVVEHQQTKWERQSSYARQDSIQELIESCSRELAQGDRDRYASVAQTLRDDLLPLLADHAEKRFVDYTTDLEGQPGWDWVALSAFIEHSDDLTRRLSSDPETPTDAIYTELQGFSDANTDARIVVQRALRSVVSIAEEEGVVMEDYADRVHAVGFSDDFKIGEHLQDNEMDLGDPVRVVSEESGALKTLFTGGTGQGKSLALETEGEDLYRQALSEGKSVKIIDPIGTGDGENWFYDVPQQDPELQRVRSDTMGLEETFLDGDYPDRDLEILVPLTPDISAENLPYDTERESFTVRPFSVPASDIRKPLLISMVTAKLTDQQESIIRDAYDEVDRKHRDWALVDLADEIKSRDELKSSKKKPVVRTLRQLQNQGFIRTRDCEYTLDWRSIFEDAETVTVFSQAFIDDVIAKLISIGYVVHETVKKRESMRRVPKCALLMRELWTVAPHKQRQEFDARAAQLQEAIGHMLAKMFRLNRRRGIMVIADTQQPSDLLKPVREMFNRYVVFNTDRDTVKDIFDWTSADQWKSFYKTLSPEAGKASIVGMVEPAVEKKNIEFVGPVEYCPPSHHHFNEDKDFTGWHSRTQYLEHEELRRPADVDGVEWADEVPDELLIEFQDGSDGRAPDVVTDPIGAFAAECLRYEQNTGVKKDRVKAAFNQFVYEHPEREEEQQQPWDFSDPRRNQIFGEELQHCWEYDDITERTTRDGENSFKNLTLTSRGEQFFSKAMDGLEDAAEPIRE